MLLARVEREDEPAVSLCISRLSGKPARHLADELLSRSEDSQVRSTKARGDTEWLSLSGDATRVIPGHGPLTDKAGLQGYHDMLVTIRDSVQTMIDDGLSLQQVVDAKPTAQWDEELGGAFIKPDQLVVFVYNSLVGVDHYTPLESSTTE